jgi:tetratricopeptide (TPR) repeat protein
MLYAGAEVVATIGVQHGRAIRWKRWRPDAPLADGSKLVAWLQSPEIEPALLDMLLQNQYDNGLSPMGYQLPGGRPLSLSEQRLRVIEVHRVRGEDTRAALAAVSEVLSSDPSVPLGHALSAVMHLELSEYELVLQDCTRARGVGLFDTRLLYATAVACHALGRLKDGVDACEEALALEPANPSILNSRGALRADLGHALEALADFEEAHRLAPQWFRPVLNRARVRIGLGAHGAAREDLRMVLSMLARPTGHEEVAARDLALRMTEQLGPG